MATSATTGSRAATTECRPEVDWREAGLLAGLAVAVVLLWGTWVVWPLKVLVVFFHELSHALAAIATGGAVHHIEVVAQQGGLAYTAGGSRFLTLSAGYLGSLAWGAFALLGARGRRDRLALGALATVIVVATVVWVRPLLSFGFGFHLAAGVALLATAAWLPAGLADGALKVFGIVSCLYVIPDIYSDTIARSGLVSDARMLAETTHVPTVVWGGLWIVVAVVITLALLRHACRPAARALPGVDEAA